MKMPAISVRFVVGATFDVEDQRVDQRRELRLLRVLAEQFVVAGRARPAVQVLVFDRDEAFVEQRIALTRDLHESIGEDRIVTRREDRHSPPARRGIDADDLSVAADRVERDVQRHRVHVESALRVEALARATQFQEVENRLNVRVETIVALSGERAVAIGEIRDGLPGVAIQLGFRGHAVTRRLFTVVVLVVLRRGVPLVVRWDDALAEALDGARAVIDPRDRVGLNQVLRGIPDVVDDAEIRLQDRLAIPERWS